MFGSFGSSKSLGKVNLAKCGKRVTGVVLKASPRTEDLEIAYQRAVCADPFNAKILRQFDLYRDIHDKAARSKKSQKDNFFKVGCMLCFGTSFCPLCKLKNDFREVFQNLERRSEAGEELFLKDLVDAALDGSSVPAE